jgi:hypothetical protein
MTIQAHPIGLTIAVDVQNVAAGVLGKTVESIDGEE